MTFYARLSGYLTYRTHDHLDAAIQHLTRGAWLNDDEQWLVRGHPRQVRADSTIDHERNLLVIPPGVYQNLGRITTELFAGATAGLVVTSSSDNCFDAWVETPLPDAADVPAGDGGDVSSIQCIDLERLALSIGLGIKRLGDPGHEQWQRDVLNAFHNRYDPDVHDILESPHAPPE
ncbi:hypothetical protein [Haloplanus halophilus]|uniref:hypothetical protein n=1 Tax=Haloplanus halophilus TaxID=2949993 RepID=UPI00203AC778|nr:hypothetical protein [Haloplanus sp. GDY1]